MGAKQNRITTLFRNDPNLITFTSQSLILTDTPIPLAYSQKEVINLSESAIGIDVMIVNKNGWVKDQEACGFYDDDFTTECEYWSFYKEYNKLLSPTLPNLPKATSECPVN